MLTISRSGANSRCHFAQTASRHSDSILRGSFSFAYDHIKRARDCKKSSEHSVVVGKIRDMGSTAGQADTA